MAMLIIVKLDIELRADYRQSSILSYLLKSSVDYLIIVKLDVELRRSTLITVNMDIDKFKSSVDNCKVNHIRC